MVIKDHSLAHWFKFRQACERHVALADLDTFVVLDVSIFNVYLHQNSSHCKFHNPITLSNLTMPLLAAIQVSSLSPDEKTLYGLDKALKALMAEEPREDATQYGQWLNNLMSVLVCPCNFFSDFHFISTLFYRGRPP